MRTTNTNHKQKLFQEMFVGILLYSVVLGFFNDYTNILHTGTYSVTFAVAIVMQILTYITFLTKDRIVEWFRNKEGAKYRYGVIFSVWLVMFLSKFVFLGAIDILFKEVEISGFVGLVVIIATMTLIQKAAEVSYKKLG